MRSRSEGSCSTCKRKRRKTLRTPMVRLISRSQQIHNIDTALPGWLQISCERRLSPPPLAWSETMIRSAERSWLPGNICGSSSVLLSQCDGNVSLPERAASPLTNGDDVRSYSLVSVGGFPQLVRSHSGWEVVVLHDILEVKFRHHLELKERGIQSDRFVLVRRYVVN